MLNIKRAYVDEVAHLNMYGIIWERYESGARTDRKQHPLSKPNMVQCRSESNKQPS